MKKVAFTSIFAVTTLLAVYGDNALGQNCYSGACRVRGFDNGVPPPGVNSHAASGTATPRQLSSPNLGSGNASAAYALGAVFGALIQTLASNPPQINHPAAPKNANTQNIPCSKEFCFPEGNPRSFRPGTSQYYRALCGATFAGSKTRVANTASIPECMNQLAAAAAAASTRPSFDEFSTIDSGSGSKPSARSKSAENSSKSSKRSNGQCDVGWNLLVKCGMRQVKPYMNGQPQKIPYCTNENSQSVRVRVARQDGSSQIVTVYGNTTEKYDVGIRFDLYAPDTIYTGVQPEDCGYLKK